MIKNDSPVALANSFQAWLVCVTAALFFFFEYMQLNMFNAIDQGLRQAFSLNATELGELSAYYFYANLITILPAGLLLDRYSTRKIILCALFLGATATLFLANAHSLELAKICRFVTGIGGSFCLLSGLRLATRWFPIHKLNTITGVIVTIGMLGGATAQVPLTLLVAKLGWRHALYCDAIFGFCVFIIIGLIVQDYPKSKRNYFARQQPSENFITSIRLVMRNKQNWLAGIYTSLLNLPFVILGSIWGEPYLHYARNIDERDTSLIIFMLFLGCIIGSSLVGYISDKLQLRKMPMIVGALLSLVMIISIIYIEDLSIHTLMLQFFILGLLTSTQVISYPLISASNPLNLTGTATSLAAFIILGSYAFFQPLFGKLMDFGWHGAQLQGLRVYSENDFSYALLLFPAAFIIAILAAMLLKETHTEVIHDSKG